VPADTRTKRLSTQHRGRNVKRRLVAGFPCFGLGVKDQALPVHFDDCLHQRPLVGVGQAGLRENLNLTALDAVAGFGHGFLIDRRWGLRLRDGLTILE